MKKISMAFLLSLLCFIFLNTTEANAQKMQITAPTKTIYVKQKVKMKVAPASMGAKVKWKTSDKKIASVTSNGTVIGKKAGKAKIYAISSKNRKTKAVCIIRVNKFKERKLSAVCSVVPSGQGDFLPQGTAFKVFQSQEELAGYLKSKKKTGSYPQLEQSLKKYQKNYFDKKSLCILYLTSGSASLPVRAKEISLKQDKNGHVSGNLQVVIGKQKPHQFWSYLNCSYFAIIELKKSDADMIQAYKASVKQEK